MKVVLRGKFLGGRELGFGVMIGRVVCGVGEGDELRLVAGGGFWVVGHPTTGGRGLVWGS
ncbi:hypothetical protein KS4_34230 [Poriferisphaera corsica]|uniref:Uncharacterized protein n=1 Tax=Poriferisphaera corsica TaxID=2528020 RepID=A0A517YYM9_9BACT|nr:hypothetical protein [Poriferisphaera corsica]QDU35342.1 hypothetical protein KS4_34230 [Poriferisphaera corsica]